MKRQKNNLENKGITLIALVITIIVLLILAGVTIATLTGENGILTKATEAQEETSYEGAREKLNLILTDLQAEKIPKGESLILGDALAGEIAAYDEVTSATFTGNVIEVVIDGYTFEVNADLGIEKQIDKVEPENLNDWEYIVEDDGTATLTCYKGTATTVVVPNYINGYWVKKIGTNDKKSGSDTTSSLWGGNITEYISGYDSWGAFVQRTIKEIKISYGIEEISDWAFEYTEGLEKVDIPKSVKKIGNYAFALLRSNTTENKNKINEVNIYEEVINMGYHVFDGRPNLIINVEREEDDIPETWDENWSKSKVWQEEQAIVNYGVTMD